jgi:hypothetical protein
VPAHWLWPQCRRMPDRWRFECKCECPLTLETGFVWESHDKRRTIINVSNSESGEPNDRPPLL